MPRRHRRTLATRLILEHLDSSQAAANTSPGAAFPFSMADCAGAIGIDPRTVSRTLAKLADEGYLSYTAGRGFGRKTLVTLHPATPGDTVPQPTDDPQPPLTEWADAVRGGGHE